MKKSKVAALLGAPLVIGAAGILWWLERRRPLRRDVEPKLKHDARNIAVAGAAAIALQITEKPVTKLLTTLVEKRGIGLLKLVRLPKWLEVPLTVLLLDYTLYLWHVLTHRVPFLWRFHIAHHVDLDLTASTALRFHFGELAISTVWRAWQILLIGVSPLSLSVWQQLLFLSIIFHHSNVRLPLDVERKLNRFIVTPRMHGIHHSVVKDETNSNWSSGLTLWDWLHGTLQLNVPQSEITVGVPAYREQEEVELLEVLKMPFVEQRPTWLLPEGEKPERDSLPASSDNLLP